MAAEDNSPVLRIKRKRTEDPLDALLVAQVYKKPCIANSDGSDQGTASSEDTDQTVERVFRYVGTVSQGASNRGKDLLTKIHSQPARHKNRGKSHVFSTETLQERLRQKRKLLHQESRFKVISSHRPNSSCTDSQSDSTEEVSQYASEKGTAGSSNDAAAADDDDVDLEVQRLFSVYDLVRDENTEDQRKRREERKSRKDQQRKEVNTILCNSMKMIREKLTVSEDQRPKEADNGFVYDFYYPSDSYGKLGEIVEVLPFDSELVDESLKEDFGEIYEDDDDSNDEGNWRNDYPDEEDSDSDSSLHRKYYEDYGFDSDEEYQRYAFQEEFSSGED